MSDPSKKLRRKKCHGKIKWFNQEAANASADRFKMRTGETMNVYQCGGHWHIGHPKNDAYHRLDVAVRNAGNEQ